MKHFSFTFFTLTGLILLFNLQSYAQTCKTQILSEHTFPAVRVSSYSLVFAYQNQAFYAFSTEGKIQFNYLKDTVPSSTHGPANNTKINSLVQSDSVFDRFNFTTIREYDRAAGISKLLQTQSGNLTVLIKDFSIDPYIKNPHCSVAIISGRDIPSFTFTIHTDNSPIFSAGQSGLFCSCLILPGKTIKVKSNSYSNKSGTDFRLLTFFVDTSRVVNLVSDKSICSDGNPVSVSTYALKNDLITVFDFREKLNVKDNKSGITFIRCQADKLESDTGKSLVICRETRTGKFLFYDRLNLPIGGKIQEFSFVDSLSYALSGIFHQKLFINGRRLKCTGNSVSKQQGFIAVLNRKGVKNPKVLSRAFGSVRPVIHTHFDPVSGIAILQFDTVSTEMVHTDGVIRLPVASQYCIFKLNTGLMLQCNLPDLVNESIPIHISSGKGYVLIFYEKGNYNSKKTVYSVEVKLVQFSLKT